MIFGSFKNTSLYVSVFHVIMSLNTRSDTGGNIILKGL